VDRIGASKKPKKLVSFRVGAELPADRARHQSDPVGATSSAMTVN
jgi:hypothetical protein